VNNDNVKASQLHTSPSPFIPVWRASVDPIFLL